MWSITYHSWLTFVLLLWACLIWTVRSRHHFAMLCSPFLLLYGIVLCSLHYIWAMELAPELPTRVGFMSLEQLGLVHPKYPCWDLGAKVSWLSLSLPAAACPRSPPVRAHRLSPQLLFTLTFWLLLRQFVKEKVLTRSCLATPLLEVTISDLGEGSRHQPPGGTPRRAEHPQGGSVRRWGPRTWAAAPCLLCRAQPAAGPAEDAGGPGAEFLRQILDLRLRRHVHRGELRRAPRRL